MRQTMVYTYLNSSFHLRFQDGGEVKYLEEARDLVKPERNTLEVSFSDIDKFNQNLATTVVEEYYRQVLEDCKLRARM